MVVKSSEDVGRDRFRERLADQHLQRRRKRRALRVGLSIASVLVFAGVWWILTATGVLNEYFFPSPVSVLVAVVEQWASATGRNALLSNLAWTLRSTVIAFAIGVAAGVSLGAAMGLSRSFRYGFRPIVQGTFPTPKVTLYPLTIVLFGLGSGGGIAIAALGSFYIACVSTEGAINSSNKIYREVATAFNVPNVIRLRKVIMPAAWPGIVTGLRLAFGAALVLTVSVEFIGSGSGIGAYIWSAWQRADTAKMFSGLFIMTLIGATVYLVGNWLENAAVPWRHE